MENTGSIGSQIDANVKPGIDLNHPQAARFPKLWEIPDSFIRFVDDLLEKSKLDGMSGGELELFCNERSIDLFYPFSVSDLKKLLNFGKIPNLEDWSREIALDDLMTRSALQSFSKDQAELDNRIRSFL